MHCPSDDQAPALDPLLDDLPFTRRVREMAAAKGAVTLRQLARIPPTVWRRSGSTTVADARHPRALPRSDVGGAGLAHAGPRHPCRRPSAPACGLGRAPSAPARLRGGARRRPRPAPHAWKITRHRIGAPTLGELAAFSEAELRAGSGRTPGSTTTSSYGRRRGGPRGGARHAAAAGRLGPRGCRCRTSPWSDRPARRVLSEEAHGTGTSPSSPCAPSRHARGVAATARAASPRAAPGHEPAGRAGRQPPAHLRRGRGGDAPVRREGLPARRAGQGGARARHRVDGRSAGSLLLGAPRAEGAAASRSPGDPFWAEIVLLPQALDYFAESVLALASVVEVDGKLLPRALGAGGVARGARRRRFRARTGDRDARTGDRDARTGDRDARTGDRDARTGDRDARNSDRDAANRSPGCAK